MTLKEWRTGRRLSQAKLARLLSATAGRPLTQSAVRYWERGTMPRRHWLEAVRDLTGGRVTANDFAGPRGQ